LLNMKYQNLIWLGYGNVLIEIIEQSLLDMVKEQHLI
jgi:hypothetical protein